MVTVDSIVKDSHDEREAYSGGGGKAAMVAQTAAVAEAVILTRLCVLARLIGESYGLITSTLYKVARPHTSGRSPTPMGAFAEGRDDGERREQRTG